MRRSSTSALIRIASRSIRRIASVVATSPLIAPWRWSSAKPRTVVSGVRNSWLASATKRRSRDSLALLTSNDSSMRVSIWLRAELSRPTSVAALSSGRRAERSPLAMAAAVFSTSSRGRKPRLTARRPMSKRSTSTTRPKRRRRRPVRTNVLLTSVSAMETTTIPPPVVSRVITR